MTGCRSGPSLPPADLTAPGWRVQNGQAVWRPGRTRPELAGDLVLATNLTGSLFVQFAKPPFPLALARVEDDRWQIQFGAGAYSRAGRGQPPPRFVWFQLARALVGATLGRGWRFQHPTPQAWRLENPRTGEWLEGRFAP